MEKSISSLVASPWQRETAQALDRAFHAQQAKASLGMSPISLSLAYADWALHLAASPGRQLLLAQHAAALLGQSMSRQPALGADGQPLPEKDPRFSDAGWSQWPFNALKNSFKSLDAWWSEAAQVGGVSRHHQHMVSFFTRQGLDALSPSNWPATNPEVLKQGHASHGQSWLKGYQRYAKDLHEQHSRRTNADADTLQALDFEVGKDVALTPGKVVFRNHLIELIQYTPTTPTVYPEPLLIVPSCIMKYYILDLSPENSMVRYLVGQGHTVFIMSWRNPDARDRDLGLQDYLQMGVMEAMAAVKSCTAAPRIHAIGYCLGGTFLGIVAALLGRRAALAPANAKAPKRTLQALGDQQELPELASVTLLAAQTDFSEPGELGVFIDDDQLQTLREEMARKGYMSGRQMAGSFQFLNSRDLIWSRNTRRYLLGQDEVGNDMMSWNADTTRLPERMHIEYLTALCLNNALAAGHYRVGGVGVALMDIKAPMLVVGTVRDHVSPWQSVYKLHLLTDTHISFILAAGGHNAGIVSEPGHAHRSYQMDSMEQGHGWTAPNEWQAKAPLHEGSWWEAMSAWLRERSGARVAPPAIDAAQVLCDAPGDYVKVRYAD
ncbi:poly-beta-hydroxybutyrate polymerase N-terminal domain-containing protein [Polaromonas sp.]|uniref:PHA/PHB synthase family protein n=1 Tax=Polaromonas sp. TaxID=1869339 RepID=UPI0017D6DB23|nr:poly-beta-hydroxybutyrate polymerase N-terminal domain-containing protein [Polaromonas sp.]NMM06564.1 poly-beta-hydroxybutyrate polymerase-like protein [Polaromonas sp.]